MRTVFVSSLLFVLPLSQVLASEGLEQAPVVARREVIVGGNSITYIRIRPPSLRRLPASPSALVDQLTPEQQAAETQRAEKDCETLSIAGMVFAGASTVTELTWHHEGRQFRAFSNIDFRHLTPLTQLETETTVYLWVPLISEGEAAGLASSVRLLFREDDATPEYYFEGTQADADATQAMLTALDYLHAYYQLHQTELVANYLKRESENTAREAELAANPPKPTDTVIHFWPEQSRINR